MPDWRPLIDVPGRRTNVLFDADGSVIFRTEQDESPILNHNKDLRNSGDNGWFAGGDMRRVASIPLALISKWLHEEGFDAFDPEQQDRLARKLNDPDYAYLRTAKGRMGPIGNGSYH